MAANQLQSDDPIHAGEALVVPVPPPPVRSAHMRYRVRRGDTIVTVADRFGVTTAELRRWNGIRSNHLPVGRRLYVSAPVSRGRHRGRHRRTERGTSRDNVHAGHSSISSRRTRGHASRANRNTTKKHSSAHTSRRHKKHAR